MNTLAPGYGLENRDPVTILKDIPTAALRMQKLQHRRDDSGAVLRRVTEERMEIRTTSTRATCPRATQARFPAKPALNGLPRSMLPRWPSNVRNAHSSGPQSMLDAAVSRRWRAGRRGDITLPVLLHRHAAQPVCSHASDFVGC